MWGIFNKKGNSEVLKLNNHLQMAFTKVSGDINHVQDWLNHLHERSNVLERIHDSHKTHIELTKKDLDKLTKWIHYLYNHNTELQKYLKDLSNHLFSLNKQDKDLLERVHSLEKQLATLSSTPKNDMSSGQDRTLQRTIKGQQEDMSSKNEDKIVSTTRGVLIKPIPGAISINKSTLTGSQVELLNLLHDSDRPLSYKELAKILDKKSKSIRNLIYEIRDKGVSINSRFVGLRKKGFFLSKEDKIKLSGR